MFIQNPKERVILLEYGKSPSSADISMVDGKNVQNRMHLNAALSPKKLPGATLLPPAVNSPPLYASEPSAVGKFTSSCYVAADEVSNSDNQAVCNVS